LGSISGSDIYVSNITAAGGTTFNYTVTDDLGGSFTATFSGA